MKARLTITLAVLALIAVGILNEFVTKTTTAQSSQPSQLSLSNPTTLVKSTILPGMSATCFCKVTANGTEVAKPTKGGFIQGIQTEACKSYCRGVWDSNPPQRAAWAKLLSNACGDVALQMDAAIGTAGYQQVRSETQHGVNGTHLVTTCTCPSGQLVSNSFGGNKYCITSAGPTILAPDQVLQGGGYLIQTHLLYLIHGPAACVTKCQ